MFHKYLTKEEPEWCDEWQRQCCLFNLGFFSVSSPMPSGTIRCFLVFLNVANNLFLTLHFSSQNVNLRVVVRFRYNVDQDLPCWSYRSAQQHNRGPLDIATWSRVTFMWRVYLEDLFRPPPEIVLHLISNKRPWRCLPAALRSIWEWQGTGIRHS